MDMVVVALSWDGEVDLVAVGVVVGVVRPSIFVSVLR